MTTLGADAGTQAFAAPLVRLVPSSGVQFLDLTVNVDGLSRTVGQFTEDHIEAEAGTRTVLVDVGRDAGHDGVVWHPLSKRPLGPEEFLTVSGFGGLEPFLDTWMPVPYLRFRGRTASGAVIHDPGPANWVRAYVAAPKEGLRAAKSLKVVLAFDTKLAPVYGTGDAPDTGPSAYDALFGSTFQINDKLSDLGMFVSEPWVDGWLSGCFAEFSRRTGTAASGFEMEHVARYLTYLSVISRGAVLPQVRFADSFSNAWQLPAIGVDLVLDMAAETTCALLVVRDTAASGAPSADAVLAGAEALSLRDLNDPVTVHTQPPSTTIEFDAHSFGSAAASRRSGRADAFQWPSLVRVGVEAERLALRTSATPGITGRHSLFAGLNEIVISDDVWRFSRADSVGVDQGPIVAGEALSHLTEDGTVIGRFDQTGAQTGVPAIRPRFSESSLLGLFVGELLMHAMVQINRAHINPPDTAGAAAPVRQLQRILVTVAAAVPEDDRRLLQTRIDGAIDLLWKAMRWDDPSAVASPPKPQVSLGIGADVSAQLLYVFDEIKTRFGGDATEYLQILRRDTSVCPPSTFRVARLDFESASTGLTVVDYEVGGDGAVRPSISCAERCAVGRDYVLAAFANNEVWPAIAAALEAAGLADARAFITSLMSEAPGQKAVVPGVLPAHFARRFDGKIIRPAAESCVTACETVPARAADTLRIFTLKTLVERGGGNLKGLAEHFNAAAAAAGAVNFRLEAIRIRIRQRDAARLIRHALEPMMAPFCELVAGQACDLVLLEGRLAQLPDLVDDLRRRLALPAHCIIDVARHVPGNYKPLAGAAAGLGAEQNMARVMGAVGAYLASQQALRIGGFKLVTADLGAGLQHYRPIALGRAAHAVNGSGAGATRLIADDDVSNAERSSAQPDGALRRRYAGAERDA
jgi:hypothetical protein